MGECMFRSDKTGHLCTLLPKMPSNFAKSGNRLTKSVQEVMVTSARDFLGRKQEKKCNGQPTKFPKG